MTWAGKIGYFLTDVHPASKTIEADSYTYYKPNPNNSTTPNGHVINDLMVWMDDMVKTHELYTGGYIPSSISISEDGFDWYVDRGDGERVPVRPVITTVMYGSGDIFDNDELVPVPESCNVFGIGNQGDKFWTENNSGVYSIINGYAWNDIEFWQDLRKNYIYLLQRNQTIAAKPFPSGYEKTSNGYVYWQEDGYFSPFDGKQNSQTIEGYHGIPIDYDDNIGSGVAFYSGVGVFGNLGDFGSLRENVFFGYYRNNMPFVDNDDSWFMNPATNQSTSLFNFSLATFRRSVNISGAFEYPFEIVEDSRFTSLKPIGLTNQRYYTSLNPNGSTGTGTQYIREYRTVDCYFEHKNEGRFIGSDNHGDARISDFEDGAGRRVYGFRGQNRTYYDNNIGTGRYTYPLIARGIYDSRRALLYKEDTNYSLYARFFTNDSQSATHAKYKSRAVLDRIGPLAERDGPVSLVFRATYLGDGADFLEMRYPYYKYYLHVVPSVPQSLNRTDAKFTLISLELGDNDVLSNLTSEAILNHDPDEIRDNTPTPRPSYGNFGVVPEGAYWGVWTTSFHNILINQEIIGSDSNPITVNEIRTYNSEEEIDNEDLLSDADKERAKSYLRSRPIEELDLSIVDDPDFLNNQDYLLIDARAVGSSEEDFVVYNPYGMMKYPSNGDVLRFDILRFNGKNVVVPQGFINWGSVAGVIEYNTNASSTIYTDYAIFNSTDKETHLDQNSPINSLNIDGEEINSNDQWIIDSNLSSTVSNDGVGFRTQYMTKFRNYIPDNGQRGGTNSVSRYWGKDSIFDGPVTNPSQFGLLAERYSFIQEALQNYTSDDLNGGMKTDMRFYVDYLVEQEINFYCGYEILYDGNSLLNKYGFRPSGEPVSASPEYSDVEMHEQEYKMEFVLSSEATKRRQESDNTGRSIQIGGEANSVFSEFDAKNAHFITREKNREIVDANFKIVYGFIDVDEVNSELDFVNDEFSYDDVVVNSQGYPIMEYEDVLSYYSGNRRGVIKNLIFEKLQDDDFEELYSTSFDSTYVDEDLNVHWGTLDKKSVDISEMVRARCPYKIGLLWIAAYLDPIIPEPQTPTNWFEQQYSSAEQVKEGEATCFYNHVFIRPTISLTTDLLGESNDIYSVMDYYAFGESIYGEAFVGYNQEATQEPHIKIGNSKILDTYVDDVVFAVYDKEITVYDRVRDVPRIISNGSIDTIVTGEALTIPIRFRLS